MDIFPRSHRELIRLLYLIIGGLGAILCTHTILAYSLVDSDFVQDYAAAHALLHGKSIYGEAISTFARELFPRATIIENFHPPFNALFFLPFSLFPYSVAFVVFNLIALSLFLMILEISLNYFGTSDKLKAVIRPLSLLWSPLYFALGTGNSSIYIAAFIVAGWVAQRKGNEVASGLAIGIATCIKFFPGLFALYFLLTRKWTALITMSMTFIVVYALSFLTIGPNDFGIYFHEMLSRDVLEWGDFILNSSLTGLLAPLLTETARTTPLIQNSSLKLILIPLAQVVVLLATAMAIKKLANTNTTNDAAFWIICPAMILMSPISWAHIFVVLIPAMLLITQHALQNGDRGQIGLLMLSLIAVSIPDYYLANLLVSWYSPEHVPWYIFLSVKLPTFGVILLWLQLIRINQR
ncbi:MAG: DUF2029 domain-containing protein [Bdellovibrionales bacterium]|nr:DUF2029 domain-containing protein [Bdellovibrionales bacterium]